MEKVGFGAISQSSSRVCVNWVSFPAPTLVPGASVYCLGAVSVYTGRTLCSEIKRERGNQVFLDTFYVARFTVLEEEKLEKEMVKLFHLSL